MSVKRSQFVVGASRQRAAPRSHSVGRRAERATVRKGVTATGRHDLAAWRECASMPAPPASRPAASHRLWEAWCALPPSKTRKRRRWSSSPGCTWSRMVVQWVQTSGLLRQQLMPNNSLNRSLRSVPAFGPSFHSGPNTVTLLRPG